MGSIEKADKQELAWNGKPVRNSKEEVEVILGPMFALFPQTGADKNTVAVYVKMLRDIDPQTLADAVLKAMNSCKFLPTVAEIREQIPVRAPGPHSEVERGPVPVKMHRLDPDEDRRQRMERLKQTKNWDRYYG
jgi:hypothetical protein